ncbi:unnamed protein product [Malus baccata var. baccata]
MVDNRTLRELATPNMDQQPLCITYPNADGGYELKSGMIHYLPKFHGFSTEDANKHLMKFHVVCSGMRPANVDEEQVKLRAFPFTLEAKAKEWLYNLPLGSMNTRNQVKQVFLEQYFSATKPASIRKDICAIRQQHGEPFGDYYERFTHLVASCPNHQISEHLLIQYFYEGLCGTDRVMLDAVSGRAFMDKTPTNAKALLKNIAGNTRQFEGRYGLPLKKVNEVCGVCSMMGHATDMCPSLMDQGGLEQANALGGFQRQQRQKYDPYSNNYNAGWCDHPHLKWNNQDNGQQSVPNNYNRTPGFFQARPHAQFQPQQQQAPSKSLENLIASLANSTQSHQQKTDKAIENLERQMSQLVSLMGQQHQLGRLPSQTVVNPNAEQMNVVTLRSGKEVFEQLRMQKRTRKDTNEQGELQTKNLEQDEASTETEKSLKATELNTKDSDKDCFNEGVGQDNLEKALVHSITHEKLNYSKHIEEELIQTMAALESLSPIRGKCSSYFISLSTSNEKTLPSVIQASKLELKPIPEHLKYAFLGEDETLLIIISSQLTAEEREKLIRVLKDHKTAIAWSIANIKGINPATCMHRILLEQGAKPIREAQRRLNPLMLEVVKKEVIKLLDVGIIHPISDSKWVSPVQVVPKRSGVTVVKNEASELVPTRVKNNWRVCTDYRKINNTTLASEDQEKTTFTCPFGTFAYQRMPFGLCNIPATFQRCMVSIFSDMIEKIIEVFMDDFSVYGFYRRFMKDFSMIGKTQGMGKTHRLRRKVRSMYNV